MTQNKDQMRAEFDEWFCSELGLPMDADTTMYDEAFLTFRAWQAARASAPPVQQSATPVLYASPEQLAAFQDKDSKFGSYLPLRKTPVGKFTQPLYTSPPSASSADSQGDTES